MSKHNELGVKGEIIALEFLEKNGYTVLEINWRFEKIEIDIIAKEKKNIVLVEVKTRNSDSYGYPEESVGKEKQKNMAIAAEEYLERNNLSVDVRFDVIAVTIVKGKPKILHIKDAFFPYE